jgi:hypothetical protein
LNIILSETREIIGSFAAAAKLRILKGKWDLKPSPPKILDADWETYQEVCGALVLCQLCLPVTQGRNQRMGLDPTLPSWKISPGGCKMEYFLARWPIFVGGCNVHDKPRNLHVDFLVSWLAEDLLSAGWELGVLGLRRRYGICVGPSHQGIGQDIWG